MQIDTKAALIRHIDQAWLALNRELNLLSETQMVAERDAAGWCVKDYLAHIRAWERSVVFFLQGKERHAGLGVAKELYLSGEEDRINAMIYANHADQPLSNVLDQFRATHQELMALIAQLTDTELHQPYRHYLPNEPGNDDGPPVIDVIYGNTAHHFQEHLRWIASLVDTQ